LFQEFKQRFQRTDRGCLDANAVRCLVNVLFQNVHKFTFDLFFGLFYLVVGLALEELAAGKSTVQAGRTDFDAHRAFDLLVMDVLALNPEFFHRLRRQECSDRCANGPIHSSQHNRIAHLQQAVD
jgi:hypothetical protein